MLLRTFPVNVPERIKDVPFCRICLRDVPAAEEDVVDGEEFQALAVDVMNTSRWISRNGGEVVLRSFMTTTG